MARMASRPRSVTVWFRGIPHMLDLVKCRRALVARQVDGDLDSMESLANATGISRSTASRFFSGRQTSLTVTLRILKALHLTFRDVATAVEGGQDPGPEPPSVGVPVSPAPRRPEPGTGLRLGA
jgi:Helix-turn-helix